MHARSTTVMGRPGMIETGIAHVQDVVMPQVRGMDGCVGLSHGRRPRQRPVHRHDGLARRGGDAGHGRQRRPRCAQQAAELLGGEATVDEWEIAYLHRDHRVADGCCARVTWTEGDPAKVDSHPRRLPDGDHAAGRAARGVLQRKPLRRPPVRPGCVTATYDSPEAMVATRDAAMGLRADLVQETGMRITEIGEFSLAIAHLDVPELV